MTVKDFIKRNYILHKLCSFIKDQYNICLSFRSTSICIKAKGRLHRHIVGKNNCINILDCTIDHLSIRIIGNNNCINIGNKCILGKGISILMEGNNTSLTIKDSTTITRDCSFTIQENGMYISIGKDCMLSNNIVLRTSDSHPIYDKLSKERLNMPKPVVLGDHVWIAPNCKIMKGSNIPNGCIIGSDSTTNKQYDNENTLIIGRPAKEIKHNVLWSREALF